MSHTIATSVVPPTRNRHAPTVFGVAVERTSRLLVVTGEFDTAAVGQFLGAAAILLGAGGGDITVDLAGMRFIDAAGLGALVRVRNSLPDGSDLVLRGVRPATRRVVAVAGLSSLLTDIS